jgi:acyl carrier protein
MGNVEAAVRRELTERHAIPDEEIHLAAKPYELGLDSLDLVELVVQFEEDFKVELSDVEVEGCNTIGDIIALVEAKLGVAEIRAPAPTNPAKKGPTALPLDAALELLEPAPQPELDWCCEHGFREHVRGSPACELAQERERATSRRELFAAVPQDGTLRERVAAILPAEERPHEADCGSPQNEFRGCTCWNDRLVAERDELRALLASVPEREPDGWIVEQLTGKRGIKLEPPRRIVTFDDCEIWESRDDATGQVLELERLGFTARMRPVYIGAARAAESEGL